MTSTWKRNNVDRKPPPAPAPLPLCVLRLPRPPSPFILLPVLLPRVPNTYWYNENMNSPPLRIAIMYSLCVYLCATLLFNSPRSVYPPFEFRQRYFLHLLRLQDIFSSTRFVRDNERTAHFFFFSRCLISEHCLDTVRGWVDTWMHRRN